jgi:predicted transcriptional regulator
MRSHAETLTTHIDVKVKPEEETAMLIGELSARTGVSQRLLRYYEEQGLLQPARDPNGYRRYGENMVTTVHQVRALLAAVKPEASWPASLADEVFRAERDAGQR